MGQAENCYPQQPNSLPRLSSPALPTPLVLPLCKEKAKLLCLSFPRVPLASCKSLQFKLGFPKLGLLPFTSHDGSFQVQSRAPWSKLPAQNPSRCSMVAKQHLGISVCSCHMIIVAKETSPLASQDTASPRQQCGT